MILYIQPYVPIVSIMIWWCYSEVRDIFKFKSNSAWNIMCPHHVITTISWILETFSPHRNFSFIQPNFTSWTSEPFGVNWLCNLTENWGLLPCMESLWKDVFYQVIWKLNNKFLEALMQATLWKSTGRKGQGQWRKPALFSTTDHQSHWNRRKSMAFLVFQGQC